MQNYSTHLLKELKHNLGQNKNIFMFKYQIYSTKESKQEIAKAWTQSMLVDWTLITCTLPFANTIYAHTKLNTKHYKTF